MASIRMLLRARTFLVMTSYTQKSSSRHPSCAKFRLTVITLILIMISPHDLDSFSMCSVDLYMYTVFHRLLFYAVVSYGCKYL